MKNRLTFITKTGIYLMGIAVLAVCGILFPELAREDAVAHPGDYLGYAFLVYAWIVAIPIFVALHHSLKLLGYIQKKTVFSNHSLRALQTIKICTIIFSVLIVVGTVSIVVITKSVAPGEDDAPFGMFGFIFTFIPIVIATFIALMQKLLQDAIIIKSENDLTV